MLKLTSRQLAFAGMLVLFVTIVAVVADTAHGASRAYVRQVICEVFGPHCGQALRVASCETAGTFNVWARGNAGERGLFQIHPTHFGWLNEAKLYQPIYNTLAAYRLSRGGTNWSAWTCRP